MTRNNRTCKRGIFWLLVALPLWLGGADRVGPFLSAGAGVTGYTDDGRLESVENRNAPLYRVGAGAFINKHLSVELGFTHFNDYDGLAPNTEKVREHFSVVSVSATGHYPLLSERVDLYGRFGAGQVFWNESGYGDRSSSAATLIFGAGIGLRPLPWLTFNVGYDLHQFGMDENTTRYDMSLGAAYVELQVLF